MSLWLKSRDEFSAFGLGAFSLTWPHYASQGLLWSTRIISRGKTVLPGCKKEGWSAKHFCKVKLTLILCKTLDTPQETKMITQCWVGESKGYGKNKSCWTHVWKDRAVGVVGLGNGRGWGIIELQWPYDSTIGEVMCWINSVPDPVFGRALPLDCPETQRRSNGDTSFWARSSSQKRHSVWQPSTDADGASLHVLYTYF